MIASAGENDCLKHEFPNAFTIGATDIKEMYKLLTGKDFEQTEPYKDRQDQLENARRLFFNATGPKNKSWLCRTWNSFSFGAIFIMRIQLH